MRIFFSLFAFRFPLALGIALLGCGDGGSTPPPPSGSIRTLAYILTDCQETAVDESPIGTQRLVIQRGDAEPITVIEHPILGPPAPFGACGALAIGRLGDISLAGGVFQRLAVTADADTVVFEVTDDLALCTDEICLRPPPLPAESQGIFRVNADGTGLRRLTDATQVPLYYEGPDFSLALPGLALSPSGSLAAVTDLGPGPDGIDRTQIVTVDMSDGTRRQITELPDAPQTDPNFPPTCCPGFFEESIATFGSTANPDDLNPTNELSFFSVDVDGTDLMKLSSNVALPDAEIDPVFTIREGEPAVTTFFLPEQAQAGPPGRIAEILMLTGTNALQLTNFGRSDTSNPILSNDGLQVFFTASADPLGTNPSHNCQIFTIDPVGANLRQLTNFFEVDESIAGCNFGDLGLGCAILVEAQDQATDTLVFYSSCDPFGTNPNGGQVFTMRPDGSEMRQITDARGFVNEPDEISGELPGPIAYSSFEK